MSDHFVIYNQTQNKVLANKAIYARTIKERVVGLLAHDNLPEGEGMIFERCNSIHMFGMRFAIDVIFINRSGKVVKVVHSLQPWRLSPMVFNASTVLELPDGTAQRTDTHVGDMVKINPSKSSDEF